MFDKKCSGQIDYEEFVCGLAVTCRGSWDEKVSASDFLCLCVCVTVCVRLSVSVYLSVSCVLVFGLSVCSVCLSVRLLFV